MATDPARVPAPPSRRWRHYRSLSGHDPVRVFLDGLAPGDRAVVHARMKLVRADPRAARHLGGHLYEVRARRSGRAYRVLFVTEGRRQQVLVAVDAFHKTTTRTPPARLRVARERAREWRSRGAELGLERGRAR